jgi:hypothetical protein
MYGLTPGFGHVLQRLHFSDEGSVAGIKRVEPEGQVIEGHGLRKVTLVQADPGLLLIGVVVLVMDHGFPLAFGVRYPFHPQAILLIVPEIVRDHGATLPFFREIAGIL